MFDKYAILVKQLVCDVSHPSGLSLYQHLSGVCNLLYDWECRQTLCLAGLFHSCYGTISYRPEGIVDISREDIKSIIGIDSERLVWLYCNCNRSDLFSSLASTTNDTNRVIMNSFPDYNTDDFIDVITLLAADAAEQYPHRNTKDDDIDIRPHLTKWGLKVLSSLTDILPYKAISHITSISEKTNNDQ